MAAVSYQDAVRLHTSALALAEKRLLVWIARRLPRWVGSDHLTALGAVGMLGAGLCYWQSPGRPVVLLMAVVCLAVNWFGDSLDGTLARVRDCQRPRYGFYLDHVLDTVGALSLLVGLGASGYMSWPVAAALLVAYYLLTIEIYLATAVIRTFRMSFLKLGPTELRIVLAIGTVALRSHARVELAGQRVLLFDVGGIVAAVGLVGIFIFSAVRNTRELYRLEPLQRSEKQGAAPRLAPLARGKEAGNKNRGAAAVSAEPQPLS